MSVMCRRFLVDRQFTRVVRSSASNLRAMGSCADCAKPGAFWEGQPQGDEVEFNGVHAYLSRPETPPQKAVLLVSDIYGYDAKNARLLSDKFTANGFLSILPDFFRNDPVPHGELKAGNVPAFLEWKDRNGPDTVLPVIDKVLEYLGTQDIASVGVLGICWGGRFAVLLGATDKVRAVVVNHGSFVEEDDVRKIKQPTMFNGSDNDQQIPKDKLERIAKILSDEAKVPSDVKAQHGWTCRGDINDPILAPKIVDAFNRANEWFQKHL